MVFIDFSFLAPLFSVVAVVVGGGGGVGGGGDVGGVSSFFTGSVG